MSLPVRDVEEKGLRMLKEFREFAMKGNVVDLAVGVIIGAAFGGIVSSLVGDIIMPVVGAITGGLDFSNYFTPLSKAVTASNLADAKKQGAVLAWGNFLTIVINFVIVAGVMFGLVNLIQRVRQNEDAKPAADGHPPGIAGGSPQSVRVVADKAGQAPVLHRVRHREIGRDAGRA